MTIRPIPFAVAAAAVAALAIPAVAQVVRPKVSLSQAVATAERELSARAFDAELDLDRGDLVYEIGLVKDGKAVEAHVDAVSGQLLRQARDHKARLPIVGEHLKAAQTAPRTLTQTIAMVEDATKGKVSDIGLERRGGRDYYEVELAGAQDREVLVDVRSGAIMPRIDD